MNATCENVQKENEINERVYENYEFNEKSKAVHVIKEADVIPKIVNIIKTVKPSRQKMIKHGSSNLKEVELKKCSNVLGSQHGTFPMIEEANKIKHGAEKNVISNELVISNDRYENMQLPVSFRTKQLGDIIPINICQFPQQVITL